MTDHLEDRLRRHLTERAATVQAEPDPTAFVDRSAGGSRRTGLVAGGVAALTLVVAGAGVLTGVNLAGAGATTQSAPVPTTTLPGRAGAALAPAGDGSAVPPAIVLQTPYTLLFTRVGPAGVTVRAYSTGTTGGSCPAPGSCAPTTTVPTTTVPASPPCPAGAMCAEPLVIPRSTAGTSAVAGPGPVTTEVPPTVSGGGGTSSAPPATSASCGQLVLELSTDRAVGTGWVVQPDTSTAPGAVQILGTGSFGSTEGAPVSWVALWAGSGVARVQLSVGGTVVDTMAPNDGVAVLALPGGSGLTGASVIGLDPGGSTLVTVPATQGVQPAGADGCPVPSVTPPSTTTSVPTDLPPATTTTGPAVVGPGPNQPVVPQGG